MKKKQATRKKSKRKSPKMEYPEKHMRQTGKVIVRGADLLFSGAMLGATISILKKHS